MHPTDDPAQPASAPRRRLGRGPGTPRPADEAGAEGVAEPAPEGAPGADAGDVFPTPPVPGRDDVRLRRVAGGPPDPQEADPFGAAPENAPDPQAAGPFGAAPENAPEPEDAGPFGVAPENAPEPEDAGPFGVAPENAPEPEDAGPFGVAPENAPEPEDAGPFGAAPGGARELRAAGPFGAASGSDSDPRDTGSFGAAAGTVPDAGPPRAGAGDEGAVAERDGRFTVRLVNFEGPFDLLLQLISKHKLDVTEVALSKVTDEFMAHIRAMGPDWDLDQTTEFLVVAATLLDLKAARLLPAAEVEDEGDLALLEARDLLFARLLQYRAYKRIADIFSDRLDAEARRYPRTVGLEPHHAALLPEVVISIGPDGFAKLAVKAMQPRAEPQVYVDHIHAPLVSVREQAEVVVARLREVGEATFQSLTEDVSDTLTVVARFLALLELYREKAVVLDQEEALGELMVRWTGGEAAQPVVTDEFDQVVEETS